ncbi:MAG: TonB family protein [Betaproteobacteria bacterium]|nr:TonB family protein [Betaproteobacteria bacterium]
MPSDTLSRTLVLSVVAVDLVGYSRKSVAEQMSLKEQFNNVLLQAIGDISVGDRIILDTGDGVAIGFLGDPEDALYVAMFMHDAINRDSTGSPSGGMDGNAIRIGINLGPVKLATGIGGHPNIIGDGINVAERIMQFAEPGQLTASRPLVEVMTRMSDHYATLFQFAGAHTDKQVRSHDVYLVGRSPAAFRQAQRGVLERAGKSAVVPALSLATTKTPAPTAGVHGVKQAIGAVPAPPRTMADTQTGQATDGGNGFADFLEDRNKVATTAFLLAVVAVTLAALLVYRKITVARPDASSSIVAAAPAAAPAEPSPVTTPPPAPATSVAPTQPLEKAVMAKSAADIAPAKPTPAPSSIATPVITEKPAAATPTVPPAKEAAPAKTSPPAATIAAPSPSTAAKDAKATERPTAKTEPAAPPVARDRLRETPPETTTARDAARKPLPKPGEQRVLPGATPVAPAYQSPEPPRQEPVAPIPPAAAPVAPPPDTTLEVISRSAPTFPKEAVRQGITSGTVRARATVDARGNVVGEVVILEARPLQAFGREARESMKTWKFNPGAPNRVYEVEISFKQ